MNYLSLFFYFCLIFVIFIYYLFPQKKRYIVLLIFSLVFYLSLDVRYILFLLFTTFSIFISSNIFKKYKSKKKLILILSIVFNTGLWFLIKVLPWGLKIGVSILNYLGLSISNPAFSIIVPIGISYYTLQAIGYLVDVYKDKITPEKNYFKFLLFISYFPAIIQGPISRYDQLSKELFETKKFKFEFLRNGLILLGIGLVKKLVIADRIGILSNYIFDNYLSLSGSILYVGAIAYAFQLYFDFSGCVDICRGISKCFGIDLKHNFNRPYLSKSIKEFWSRWHISLSSWLKEYIYIPLGGNRKGTRRKYINIVITFLISGLWHGAGLSFIFWGLLHAFYQIFSSLTHNIRSKIKTSLKIKENSISDNIFKTLITFNLVCIAWIFFRATSFMSAIQYIKNIIFASHFWNIFDGSIYTFGLNQFYIFLLILHIFIIFLIEHKFNNQESVINSIINLHIVLRWCIYLVLIFDILLFGAYGTGFDISNFMYGGF